jgi:hypothetical protein
MPGMLLFDSLLCHMKIISNSGFTHSFLYETSPQCVVQFKGVIIGPVLYSVGFPN